MRTNLVWTLESSNTLQLRNHPTIQPFHVKEHTLTLGASGHLVKFGHCSKVTFGKNPSALGKLQVLPVHLCYWRMTDPCFLVLVMIFRNNNAEGWILYA